MTSNSLSFLTHSPSMKALLMNRSGDFSYPADQYTEISISGAPHRRNRLLVIRLRSDSSGGRHGQGAAGVQDSDWTTTGARRVPKTRSQRSGTSQAERQRERIGKGFRTVGPDSPFRAERGKEPGHAAEVIRGQLSRHGLGVRQRSDASRATDGYGAGQL
jgi:hypothetical protein